MKNILTIIIISSLLFPQKIFESFDLGSDHSFIKTNQYVFTVDEKDKESRVLIIKNIIGEISIQGAESNKVNIVEEIKIRSSSERKAKKFFEDIDSEITKSTNGNVIKIDGGNYCPPKINYKYTIKIPSEFNLDIRITAGGIQINDVFGEVDAATSGGDIDLSSISGKIIAKTAGGDVGVEDSEGSIALATSGGDIEINYTQGQVSAKTSGGDIAAYRVEGNVDVYTSGGSIDLSFINGKNILGNTSGGDIDAEDIQGNIELRTSGGDIMVEDVDGNFYGKTSGGDIDLESVNGLVEMFTTAGSIYGSDLGGSVRAEASSGDIEIRKIWNSKLDRHDLNLKTNHGNINLSIPKEFPSTINSRILGHSSDYEIESDLPISVTTDFNNIYGYFVNNDGTYSIELQTTNGDINIEEED